MFMTCYLIGFFFFARLNPKCKIVTFVSGLIVLTWIKIQQLKK